MLLKELNANKRTHLLVGDITTINTDAIVNSSNVNLLAGSGVCGVIHKAAGSKVTDACKALRETTHKEGLKKGTSVSTTAGNLKAKYIIHTAAPRYGYDKNANELLENCYKSALIEADLLACRSIAFPSLATGIYGFPKDEAGKIAYAQVCNTLTELNYVTDVVFVFYTDEDASVFRQVNGI